MRRLIRQSIWFMAGAALATPLSVRAMTPPRGAPEAAPSGALDRQAAIVLEPPGVQINSVENWIDVPGLTGLVVCAKNEISVGITVNPLWREDFRIQVDDRQILKPSRFHAQFQQVSISATFVGKVAAIGGSDTHVIDLQAKPIVGETVWVHDGALNVQFEDGVTC